MYSREVDVSIAMYSLHKSEYMTNLTFVTWPNIIGEVIALIVEIGSVPVRKDTTTFFLVGIGGLIESSSLHQCSERRRCCTLEHIRKLAVLVSGVNS